MEQLFDRYQTAIGKNPRISPVEKITYLQTLCTGSAKSLIESYGTNSSQYDQANEELIRRIGNPKFIVTAYIEQLEDFEQPHLRDPLSFVRYSTFLRKLVHNFEANGHFQARINKCIQNCSQQAPSCCFDEMGGVLYTPRFGISYLNRFFKSA